MAFQSKVFVFGTILLNLLQISNADPIRFEQGGDILSEQIEQIESIAHSGVEVDKKNRYGKYIEGIDYELVENPYYAEDGKSETLLDMDLDIQNHNFIDISYWDYKYDPDLAKRLYYYMMSVYKKNVKKEMHLCMDYLTKNYSLKHYYRSKDEDVLKNGATAMIVIDHDIDAIIVAFKGSSNVGDWINNFHLKNVLAFKNKCETDHHEIPGYVHDGHCQYYKALVEKHSIKSDLAELVEQHPDFEVIITGHSLGGALASLFNSDLYDTMGIKAHVYTFGANRVTDWDFAMDLATNKKAKSYYRIVSGKDIVPHLPPKLKLKGSQSPHHPVTEIWYPDPINDPFSYKVCPGNGDSFLCSNSLKHFMKWNVKDHNSYFNISHPECQAEFHF